MRGMDDYTYVGAGVILTRYGGGRARIGEPCYKLVSIGGPTSRLNVIAPTVLAVIC